MVEQRSATTACNGRQRPLPIAASHELNLGRGGSSAPSFGGRDHAIERRGNPVDLGRNGTQRANNASRDASPLRIRREQLVGAADHITALARLLIRVGRTEAFDLLTCHAHRTSVRSGVVPGPNQCSSYTTENCDADDDEDEEQKQASAQEHHVALYFGPTEK